MEPANLNFHRHHQHHQLQDHQLGATSSSHSSCYGVAIAPHANLSSSSSLLNTNSLRSYPSENSLLSTTSMAQDHLISFNWADSTGNFIPNQTAQDLLHRSMIKEELGDSYYLKYPELSSSTDQEPCQKTNHEQLQLQDDLCTKFLLKSLSSGNDILFSPANGERGLIQIFPSVNVSNSNQNGLTSQGLSLDMNLEALDLLTSSRLSGNILSPSLQNQIGMIRDCVSYGFDHHMQQRLHQYPMYSINKISSSNIDYDGVAETKRSISEMESKQTKQNATKKSRVAARASCPPLKVRKEKLGDKIAALQQQVAPFGKTDTASVLMEAIGYIKFLQSQVETLSVPYMKAARDKSDRLNKWVPIENEGEELKHDLKSRGLCLIPLSWLSGIADGGGATVWPPPYFGGAT